MKIFKKDLADYQTIDFLLDDSFIEWIQSGKPKDNVWHSRLNKKPSLAQFVRESEELIRKINFNENDPSDYRINRIKNGLDSAIKEHVPIVKGTAKKKHSLKVEWHKRKYSVLAAAVLVPLLVFSILFLTHEPPEQSSPLITKATGNGQKLTVFLTDGSSIKLNSASSLRYNEFFADSSRVVYLEGEAFFEIAKDSIRPFKVHTKYSTTTALGTSFNIRVDSVLQSSTVSLRSGKVSVEDDLDAEKQKVILLPGQQAISYADRPMVIEKYEKDEFAWKEGVLVFKNESYQQVFDKLERWYGVKFQFTYTKNSMPINEWNYSGAFQNENIEAVLKGISYVKAFSYEINSKEIIIKL